MDNIGISRATGCPARASRENENGAALERDPLTTRKPEMGLEAIIVVAAAYAAITAWIWQAEQED